MKITNDLLLGLMQQVDQGLEVLLSDIALQRDEIERLTAENKHLRENYAKISEQISLYIAELEAIKYSKT